jgi:hypothetical protein
MCINTPTDCGSSCTNCFSPYAGATTADGTWPVCQSGQCASVCIVGFASCGGKCVDPNTDASNCGACGNTCDAGVCVGGQCTTLSALQVVPITANDIAVDGSNLYAADKVNNNVWKFDKSTFAQTLIAGSQDGPTHVAIDSAFVYWTSNLGGAVLRAPIGGGNFQVLYSADHPLGVEVDASNVYWSDLSGIHAAPKAGQGMVTNLYTSNNGAVADPIAQDSTRIYAEGATGPTPARSIFSVDKVTGAQITWASSFVNLGVAGLAPADGYLYWAWVQSGSQPPQTGISGAPTQQGTGPDVGSAFPWNTSVGWNLVAEHCAVYWSGQTGATNALYKIVPGGSPPRALTTAATKPGAVALDDKYLYWADQGFIGRVPK